MGDEKGVLLLPKRPRGRVVHVDRNGGEVREKKCKMENEN